MSDTPLHPNMPETGEKLVTLTINRDATESVGEVLTVQDRSKYLLGSAEFCDGHNRHNCANLWPCEIKTGPGYAPLGMQPYPAFILTRTMDAPEAIQSLRLAYIEQARKVAEEAFNLARELDRNASVLQFKADRHIPLPPK